jgi:hypothetical protein
MVLDDLHDAQVVFKPRKRKLTIQQIAEAMELRSKGIGYERLGMIFGRKHRTVCVITLKALRRHGYNWWRL